uniref:Major facilitator superfamily (MFS) profile domain-containing protein n=1 Tax=Acrobeloides nanus TaxID=290746 RepID=A0A914DV42_9BILA
MLGCLRNAKLYFIRNFTENSGDEPRTRWKSIWVSTIVAFIESITASSLTPSVWPYMQQLNPSSTETYYGVLRGVYSLGNVVAATVAGYLSNRFNQTKSAMILAKSIAIVSAIAFILIEVISAWQMALFLVFQLLLGASVGTATVYRTHIAMASTEEDRSKAVGISQMANALGFVSGAVIQMIFAAIKYPGLKLLFGTHLNLYTAPIYFTIFISIIGIVLLVLYFDGRMRILDPTVVKEDIVELATIEPVKLETTDSNSCEPTPRISYDIIAISICIFTNLVLGLISMISTTILPTYSMTVFQWTSEQSVMYNSMAMGAVGVLYILWNIAYMFLRFGQRLPSKIAVIVSLVIFLLFYFTTFPWPFLSGTIEYQRNITTSTGTNETIGCKSSYSWCAHTPPINVVIYFISLVIAQGIALPLSMINMDILYSKILGPIKQGTLQGIFSAARDLLAIVGPLGFAQIYVASGTIYIWISMVVLTGICLSLWAIFYKRMISYVERVHKLPP